MKNILTISVVTLGFFIFSKPAYANPVPYEPSNSNLWFGLVIAGSVVAVILIATVVLWFSNRVFKKEKDIISEVDDE